MKKQFAKLAAPLFPLLTIAILLFAASCSKSEDEEVKFDKARTQQLIKEYDSNGGKLSPEQYDELITNTTLLYADIKQQMKDLLSITEPLKFAQEYQRLKNDNDFMERITIREQVWRVLVLGQKDFSAENIEAFNELPKESSLIDYYDDQIRTRLTDAIPE
ncbi:MAG: hypothetical protein HDS69_05385 [Bacteroidales bacterium]|nr:hypothetical protein [Bacteroidales bacterium]